MEGADDITRGQRHRHYTGDAGRLQYSVHNSNTDERLAAAGRGNGCQDGGHGLVSRSHRDLAVIFADDAVFR
jgi:hypothetical protein